MSFCRILSTLCSHVVFHNIPHLFRTRQRAGQKVHRKIAAAVQNVKTPLLFVPLFRNPRKIFSRIILFVLVIKLTIIKERDGGFREGGIRGGEIGGGEIVEGGC